MTDTTKQMAYAKGRDTFIERLGLRAHNFGMFEAATIRRFEWPAKANGTRYDRTVLLAVYSDGSWGAYLDDAHLAVEDAIAAHRRMALADETHDALPGLVERLDKAAAYCRNDTKFDRHWLSATLGVLVRDLAKLRVR